jgi:dipeptidase E
MKLYLSSYNFGNEKDKIVGLMPKMNKKIGYIPNAMDFSGVDKKKLRQGINDHFTEFRNLGIKPQILDLRKYFEKKSELQKKLDELGGVWVRGGNTFVLRQAMKLSGFDKLIHRLKKRTDFLYGGYSAGICILAPSLESLQIVDDPTELPYKQQRKVIMEGLGILDYMILPHYKSDHPESAEINKEVAYCKRNKIPFKTLRDGEVIIIEK